MSIPPSASRRIVFVDLLRGWAVVFMIETHVVNALLQTDLRQNPYFMALTSINGLVAPSFLFCAGFALAITLQRKWADYISLKPPLWKYFLRLSFILVIAYCLHLPLLSLRGMLTLEDAKKWEIFFQSDILHVISITLFFIVVLALFMRNQKLHYVISGSIAFVFIFFAPPIREMDYSSIPIWLRPFFTLKYQSQFPLFPWSAFLICGFLVGSWILYRRNFPDRWNQSRTIIGLASIAMIVLALISESIPFSFYPNHNFWKASPEFFFARLGAIMLLLFLCWYFGKQEGGWLQKSISLFGVESLLIYTVHLLVVYGSTFEWSFIRLWGRTKGYGECFFLSLALIGGMYILAFGWRWLKEKNKMAANVVQYAILGGTVIRFILW